MIFGYCRLSTIEQSRGQTLEAQISLLEQWGIDKVYYDLESGRKTDREQFNQMLDDARKTAAQGEAVIIRVARHDRWARNVVYSLQTIEELESLGVVLESRDRGHITLQTAIDWQITANEAVAAEMESRRISERVRRGVEFKRQENRPLSNTPPFGYRHSQDKTKLEPNTAEWADSGLSIWELARMLVDKILDGYSLYKASMWLFDEHGKKLSPQGLKNWIYNPTIRGHLWYHSVPRDTKSKKILTPSQHEALITEEEFMMLRYALSIYSSYRGSNRHKGVNAIPTSFMICGHCGHRMVVMHNRNRKKRLLSKSIRCNQTTCESRAFARNSIKQEVIEAAIQEALLERAEDLMKALDLSEDDTQDPNLIAKQQELSELQELYRRSQRESLKYAIADVEAELKAMQEPSSSIPAIDPKILEKLKQPTFWSKLDDSNRRQLYLELVRRIEVRDRQIVRVDLLL